MFSRLIKNLSIFSSRDIDTAQKMKFSIMDLGVNVTKFAFSCGNILCSVIKVLDHSHQRCTDVFFGFCKIFKDNFFLEHLQTAASVTLLPTLIEVFFFRYHFTKTCSFNISLLKRNLCCLFH